MTNYALDLPDVITDDRPGRAIPLLRRYFDGSGAFSGAYWDTFDPSLTRARSENFFTCDDIVSAALLNTPVGNTAAVRLLITDRDEFSSLLAKVPADCEFIDIDPDPDGPVMGPAFALYEALKDLPQVGPTVASKLLARKRPHLFAIIDSVLSETVFAATRRDSHEGRRLLHQDLAKDGQRVWRRLVEYRRRAGLSAEVSVLRVFDVLAWMTAKGY